MQPASYAPIYIGIYPELAELCRVHGYALAVHGSLSRDFDLICIPWVKYPSTPQILIDDIVNTFALTQIGNSSTKEHGRIVYTISISFGECFIDLSIMPTMNNEEVCQKNVN